MRVLLAHPNLVSCECCAAYAFKKAGGEVMRVPGTGEPMERGTGQPTPCSSCPKVPTWAKAAGKDWRELRTLAAELTPANRLAYEHYVQCKAVGRFPDDPIVEWVAGVVRRCEDEDERRRGDRTHRAFVQLIELLPVKR